MTRYGIDQTIQGKNPIHRETPNKAWTKPRSNTFRRRKYKPLPKVLYGKNYVSSRKVVKIIFIITVLHLSIRKCVNWMIKLKNVTHSLWRNQSIIFLSYKNWLVRFTKYCTYKLCAPAFEPNFAIECRKYCGATEMRTRKDCGRSSPLNLWRGKMYY